MNNMFNLKYSIMKRCVIILSVFLFSLETFSQGTILSLTVSPASPTSTDNVYVYADLQFSSMGCAVDHQGHSTTGSNTNASAHHCMGMLSAICNTVDTFNLGTLPAGPHVFQLTLSSGFGGPPCSPGIVPDDTETLTFNVTSAVGIQEEVMNSLISVFPNPFSSETTIKLNSKITSANAAMYDVLGKCVRNISFSGNAVKVERLDLKAGIYFIQLSSEGDILETKKIIIQ
jgi:hypothetical protein